MTGKGSGRVYCVNCMERIQWSELHEYWYHVETEMTTCGVEERTIDQATPTAAAQHEAEGEGHAT